MKTSLLEGKIVSVFDKHLLQQLSHLPLTVGMPTIKLGVENEYGQIYRLIETGDIVTNAQVVERLREVGYFVSPLDPSNEHTLWAIVKLQEA